jgi:hypothetical protein
VAVARVLMVIDLLLIVSFVTCGLMGLFWPALLAAWAVGSAPERPRAGVQRVDQPGPGSEDARHNQLVGGPGRRPGTGRGRTRPRAHRLSRVVPAAMVTSGLLSAPSMLLYLRAMRRGTVGTLAPDQIEGELVIEE